MGVSQQRRILIIKWMDDLSMGPSQPLSPATPASANGLKDNVALVAGMEVTHGLPLTRRTWLGPPLRAPSASSRDHHGAPNMASFPKVTRQLPGGGLTALAPVHHGRGSVVLTGTHSTNGFAFSDNVLLPKLPSVGSQNVLSTTCSPSIAPGQGTHFIAKEYGSEPTLVESLVLPCSHHPEAAALTEWRLLEIQLRHQRGGTAS